MTVFARRFGPLTRWATDAPVQAGIAGASWSVTGTLARGLLPRSATQQAVATGVVAATHFQLTATAWATLQALGARPGERPGTRANLVIASAGIVGGLGLSAATSRYAATSMPAAAAATAGRITAFAALAGGSSALWDCVLHKRLGLRPGLDTTLIPAVATGAAVVAVSVLNRSRRAAKYGIVAPERRAIRHVGPEAALKAGAIGIASGVGLAAATGGEQLLARAVEKGMARVIGRDPGALGSLIAHGTILGSMAVGAVVGLNSVTSRIQRRDDIVEPAYPVPPTSRFVSAGPASSMPFDSLGKEGRRFVLMALSADEISTVMSQTAVREPVRVVGGFESSPDIAERARKTIKDMEDCGAFDRSLICVGSPTGVGYFNYSLAEALEYLTLGDCAIVVPQYALVPSALALTRTAEAERLTRLVLEGIRDRLALMPPDERPRVVLIGESLGANVALDIANDAQRPYLPALNPLGVAGGLYLGVPFRTRLWNAWRAEPAHVDPEGRLLLVAEPDHADQVAPGHARHLMLVHHDDPVNKYSFRMVLQPPWWLGPPVQRPPLVPREVKFRPITSFVLATVDLLNGMNSKPGTFVRRGHDYRIDIRAGLERAFGLTSTPTQSDAIEAALRARETEWATRRMVARKLDKARRAIEKQLSEWGSPTISVADLDPANADTAGLLQRIGVISGPPSA